MRNDNENFLPRESLSIAKLVEEISRAARLQRHGRISGFRKWMQVSLGAHTFIWSPNSFFLICTEHFHYKYIPNTSL